MEFDLLAHKVTMVKSDLGIQTKLMWSDMICPFNIDQNHSVINIGLGKSIVLFIASNMGAAIDMIFYIRCLYSWQFIHGMSPVNALLVYKTPYIEDHTSSCII